MSDRHLRHRLLLKTDSGSDDHTVISTAHKPICPITARLHRLKGNLTNRRRQERYSQDRPCGDLGSSELASTTRTLLVELNSGELPLPGSLLHLTPKAQEQLKQFNLSSERDIQDANDRDREMRSSSEDQQPCWIPDLAVQNKQWIESASTLFPSGPAHIRYRSNSPESEHNVFGDCPFKRAKIAAFPKKFARMTPVDSKPQSSAKRLTEMARKGEFSELSEALKKRRMDVKRKEVYQDSTGCIFHDAIDTYISGASGVNERSPGRIESYKTAFEKSVDSSFRTCEPYFLEESSLEPTDLPVFETISEPATQDEDRVLNAMIQERQGHQEQDCQRNRIIAITRMSPEPQSS